MMLWLYFLVLIGVTHGTSPTPLPSAIPTQKPSPVPSVEPTPKPSALPSLEPTPRPTGHPTSQPSSRPTHPTGQPTSKPSHLPTGKPTGQPSRQPSSKPSRSPTGQPTRQPSGQPTSKPSRQPSGQPTRQPTRQPTGQPSRQPTSRPSRQPSRQPSSKPSRQPTSQPSMRPTRQPTSKPSRQPTGQPTMRPSTQPSRHPTGQPSRQPSSRPSMQPTRQPTGQPSAQPSRLPTVKPSGKPSGRPSGQPTGKPSGRPSRKPTGQPSGQPSRRPSTQPSAQPTSKPTSPTGQPTGRPTGQPSCQPTMQPSSQPSRRPTGQPTRRPTTTPTGQPSRRPTMQPSVQPSSRPSARPSGQPTMNPTGPTGQPSAAPSGQPSRQPTANPTGQPSSIPTGQPSLQPFAKPTGQPSVQPSGQPSGQPSDRPSGQPTMQPSASRTTLVTFSLTLTMTGYGSTTADLSRRSYGTSVFKAAINKILGNSEDRAAVGSSFYFLNPPTPAPTRPPTKLPTPRPTQPTAQPTVQPTAQPTVQPTGQPTGLPSQQPSCQPTTAPSTPSQHQRRRLLQIYDAGVISFQFSLGVYAESFTAAGGKYATNAVQLAYDKAISTINQAIVSGTFTNNLVAAVASYNSSDTRFKTHLSSLQVSTICYSATLCPICSNGVCATGTYTATIVKSAKPTGTPTSQPSRVVCDAGSYHDRHQPQCHICDAGTYSTVIDAYECGTCPAGTTSPKGSTTCHDCDIGYYAPVKASTQCFKCTWPSNTLKSSSTGCNYSCYCLDSSQLSIAVNCGILLYLFLILESGWSRKDCLTIEDRALHALRIFAFTIIPVIDVVTDFIYIMSSRYFNSALLALSIIFALTPTFYFLYKLYRMGALLPRLMIPLPYFVRDTRYLLWLRFERGWPRYVRASDPPYEVAKHRLEQAEVDLSKNKKGVRLRDVNMLRRELSSYGPEGQLPWRKFNGSFDKHDSLPKLLSFWIFWAVLLALQGFSLMLWFAILIPILMLNSPVIITWLVVGAYLFQSKCLAMGNVWNVWVKFWLGHSKDQPCRLVTEEGKEPHFDPHTDTVLYNESFFAGIFFEALPQIIIQSANNYMIGSYTWFAALSIASSAYMIALGMWRLYAHAKVVFEEEVLAEPQGIFVETSGVVGDAFTPSVADAAATASAAAIADGTEAEGEGEEGEGQGFSGQVEEGLAKVGKCFELSMRLLALLDLRKVPVKFKLPQFEVVPASSDTPKSALPWRMYWITIDFDPGTFTERFIRRNSAKTHWSIVLWRQIKDARKRMIPIKAPDRGVTVTVKRGGPDGQTLSFTLMDFDRKKLNLPLKTDRDDLQISLDDLVPHYGDEDEDEDEGDGGKADSAWVKRELAVPMEKVIQEMLTGLGHPDEDINAIRLDDDLSSDEEEDDEFLGTAASRAEKKAAKGKAGAEGKFIIQKRKQRAVRLLKTVLDSGFEFHGSDDGSIDSYSEVDPLERELYLHDGSSDSDNDEGKDAGLGLGLASLQWPTTAEVDCTELPDMQELACFGEGKEEDKDEVAFLKEVKEATAVADDAELEFKRAVDRELNLDEEIELMELQAAELRKSMEAKKIEIRRAASHLFPESATTKRVDPDKVKAILEAANVGRIEEPERRREIVRLKKEREFERKLETMQAAQGQGFSVSLRRIVDKDLETQLWCTTTAGSTKVDLCIYKEDAVAGRGTDGKKKKVKSSKLDRLNMEQAERLETEVELGSWVLGRGVAPGVYVDKKDALFFTLSEPALEDHAHVRLTFSYKTNKDALSLKSKGEGQGQKGRIKGALEFAASFIVVNAGYALDNVISYARTKPKPKAETQGPKSDAGEGGIIPTALLQALNLATVFEEPLADPSPAVE